MGNYGKIEIALNSVGITKTEVFKRQLLFCWQWVCYVSNVLSGESEVIETFDILYTQGDSTFI